MKFPYLLNIFVHLVVAEKQNAMHEGKKHYRLIYVNTLILLFPIYPKNTLIW